MRWSRHDAAVRNFGAITPLWRPVAPVQGARECAGSDPIALQILLHTAAFDASAYNVFSGTRRAA